MSEPDSEQWEPPRWLAWGFVVLMCAAGLLSGLIEVLLIPLYVGTVPLPVSVVLALVLNVVIPWLSYDVLRRPAGAILPVVVWLVTVFTLISAPGGNGDVLGPGGDLSWVTYGVLFGGAIAAAVGVIRVTTPRSSRPR